MAATVQRVRSGYVMQNIHNNNYHNLTQCICIQCSQTTPSIHKKMAATVQRVRSHHIERLHAYRGCFKYVFWGDKAGICKQKPKKKGTRNDTTQK